MNVSVRGPRAGLNRNEVERVETDAGTEPGIGLEIGPATLRRRMFA